MVNTMEDGAVNSFKLILSLIGFASDILILCSLIPRSKTRIRVILINWAFWDGVYTFDTFLKASMAHPRDCTFTTLFNECTLCSGEMILLFFNSIIMLLLLFINRFGSLTLTGTAYIFNAVIIILSVTLCAYRVYVFEEHPIFLFVILSFLTLIAGMIFKEARFFSSREIKTLQDFYILRIYVYNYVMSFIWIIIVHQFLPGSTTMRNILTIISYFKYLAAFDILIYLIVRDGVFGSCFNKYRRDRRGEMPEEVVREGPSATSNLNENTSHA